MFLWHEVLGPYFQIATTRAARRIKARMVRRTPTVATGPWRPGTCSLERETMWRETIQFLVALAESSSLTA